MATLKQKWQAYSVPEKAACIIMPAAGVAAVLLCIPAMRGSESDLCNALLLCSLAVLLAADGILRRKRSKTAAAVLWCIAAIFLFMAVRGLLYVGG